MFIFHLIDTVKLPGIERFYTKIAVHTATQNFDVCLAQEFHKCMSNASRKNSVLDHVKQKKGKVKKSGQTGSIMCNIIKMPSIKT